MSNNKDLCVIYDCPFIITLITSNTSLTCYYMMETMQI